MDRAKSCSTLESRAQQSLSAWVQQPNKGCCLLVFLRILAPNNQQNPPGGISMYFGLCRIFAQTLFHHSCLYLGADPGYSLGLARSKASAPQTILLPRPSPPPDPSATGASTASGRIAVFQPSQRGSGTEAKPNIPCTNKNRLQPHICHVFWSNLVCTAQSQPSRIKPWNCTLSPWYISPLRYLLLGPIHSHQFALP